MQNALPHLTCVHGTTLHRKTRLSLPPSRGALQPTTRDRTLMSYHAEGTGTGNRSWVKTIVPEAGLLWNKPWHKQTSKPPQCGMLRHGKAFRVKSRFASGHEQTCQSPGINPYTCRVSGCLKPASPNCMRRGDVGTCNVVLSTSTPRSQKEILSSPGKHSTLQVPISLCVCKNAAWQISCQRQDEASVEHNAQALTPMSQDAFCCGVLRYSAMQGCSWPDVEDTASSQPSKDVLESEVRGEP